jgi:hypothetical protein
MNGCMTEIFLSYEQATVLFLIHRVKFYLSKKTRFSPGMIGNHLTIGIFIWYPFLLFMGPDPNFRNYRNFRIFLIFQVPTPFFLTSS